MKATRTLVSTAAATALAALLAAAPACGGGSSDAPAAASPQTAHGAHGDPEAGQHAGHKAGHPAGHGQGGHQGGPVQHSFERAEDWARLFDHPSRDAWQKPDEVVALVDLSPGMSVVDVGAGTGYFMTRLSRAVGPGGTVVATDIEPDMVRYMKERAAREKLANVQVVTAPVDDVGVPAGSADRILIVDVWHHIADRERYAAKMARALKPGGAVLVVDFTMETRRGPSPRHRLPPDRVIAELAAGGLVAELATETLPDQYVVIGRRR
jgi:ubiquinone/menaquinone biosynthesis C-methylase UbiE